jgi:hypothetical protein
MLLICLSSFNALDGGGGNSIFFSYYIRVSQIVTNKFHLFFREFRIDVSRPTRASSLSKHIQTVLLYGPEKQMVGVNAGRGITDMADQESLGNRASIPLPDEARYPKGYIINSHNRIPIRTTSTSPNPTPGHRFHANELLKSFLNWRLDFSAMTFEKPSRLSLNPSIREVVSFCKIGFSTATTLAKTIRDFFLKGIGVRILISHLSLRLGSVVRPVRGLSLLGWPFSNYTPKQVNAQ